MANILQGDRAATTGQFGIVVARFNETVTQRLLDGALSTLSEAGVADSRIDVCWVPGAWEIPIIAGKLTQTGKYAAVICLGAVIRGETTHDQYINLQVSVSLGRLAIDCGVPILFGLLTCQTIEQALQRAGGNVGNKGADCAHAALEMVSLIDQIAG